MDKSIRNIKEVIKRVLYADNIIGYFVTLFAIAVITITLGFKFGFNALDKTPQWFNDIMNYGGIVLIMASSFVIGVVFGERIIKRGDGFIKMMTPKFGAGEAWDNHPYYVTGSNENTRTVSDNYLPTL